MNKGESKKVMKRGGLRDEYFSLLAKRPLRPSDIHRLEILTMLIMHQEPRRVSK